MHYIVGNSPLKIDPAGGVTGYVIPTKQLVDRQASKEKRAPFQPFIEFMQSYMKLLQMPVPKPETPAEYHEYQRELANYIINMHPVPEDRYIQMMVPVIYYSYWTNMVRTFEQAKSKLYREFTEYRIVELPVGSLQGR